MAFVLRLMGQQPPRFVAKSGSDLSYTRSIQNALVFQTSREAKASACANEIVVPIYIAAP